MKLGRHGARHIVIFVLLFIFGSCSQGSDFSGRGNSESTDSADSVTDTGETEDKKKKKKKGLGDQEGGENLGAQEGGDNLGDQENNPPPVGDPEGNAILGFPEITSPVGLIEACDKAAASGTVQTVIAGLNFPENGGPCENTANPGSGLEGFTEEPIVFDTIPAGAVICDLKVDSTGASLNNVTDNFLYDDVEFLTLGDYLVATTHSDYLGDLNVNGNLATYDWDAVKDRAPIQSGNVAWCVGGAASDCYTPEVDTADLIRINPEVTAFSEVAYNVALNSNQLDFKLVTAGDSPSDCRHSELSLEFTIKYLAPPQ